MVGFATQSFALSEDPSPEPALLGNLKWDSQDLNLTKNSFSGHILTQDRVHVRELRLGQKKERHNPAGGSFSTHVLTHF